MEDENRVKIHSMRANTYSKRVEIAIRLKGIPYECIEEDLSNKSQLLLKYNPVYKKVPVLVHNGKSIAKSYIILEYIDETWKNAPQILPEDPYERAKVRFWASYIQQQVMSLVLTSRSDAQEKALEEVFERLKVFEGVEEYLQGGASFTNGESLALTKLMNYKAYEEFFGYKMLDPERKRTIHARSH